MNFSLPVYVTSSDKTAHVLPALAYCFEKFWPDQIVHVLFNTKLPRFTSTNMEFHSLGDMVPVNEWSNPIREWLEKNAPEYFIFGLDDMLPCFHVHVPFIRHQYNLCKPGLGRIGLVYSKRYPGKFGLTEVPQNAPYRASTQYSIWSKAWMMECLKPNMSPWKFEKPGPRNDGAKVYISGKSSSIHICHGLPNQNCKHGIKFCVCCQRRVNDSTVKAIRSLIK